MRLSRAQGVAVVALLAAGLLLGITTNLAKVAHRMDIPPLSYLTWSMMGASALLLAYSVWRKQLPELTLRTLEYFFVSSLLTTVAANLIFFEAVPRLGAGFVAITIALPPVITYLGALLVKMERFNGWRALGVLLALVGIGLLVIKTGSAPGADVMWVGLTLIGPLLLSLGNLYRSHRWPDGATSEMLAPGMLIMGVALLLIYAAVFGHPLELSVQNPAAPFLILIQSLVFAGQFLLMFVVQKHGGAVFLSLMGGVSAIFAIPIAVLFLGEAMLPGMVICCLLVAGGIVGLLLGEASTVDPEELCT